MAEDNVMKSMTLLPEYQEEFLKNLLANIYQVDPETGTITGIAAQSPLEGQQYYQTEDGGVVVVIPADNCGLTVEEIAQKDVPSGRPYKIVDVSEVPSDRTFRDAWEYQA